MLKLAAVLGTRFDRDILKAAKLAQFLSNNNNTNATTTATTTPAETDSSQQQQQDADSNLQASNDNNPSQAIISKVSAQVDDALRVAEEQDLIAPTLPVSSSLTMRLPMCCTT